MQHTRWNIGAAALTVLAPLCLGGQSPPPTFKTGVDLVRLDVRVIDSSGFPIRDLRADEIRVTDGGRDAPVTFFQHIEEPVGTPDEVAHRTISGEVSTNRGASRGHLYVLAFDQQHIAPGNEQRARIAAQRFLKTRVRPGDRVAVFALPGPGPQLRFTSDVNAAINQLPMVRGALERTDLTGVGAMAAAEAYQIVRGDQLILARVVARLSAESTPTEVLGGTPQARRATSDSPGDLTFTRSVIENAQTVVAKADGDARRFLILLARLMREMRSIDGRKSVVVFSEGFFADNVTREIEDAAAAAAQSYSVVYAMDLIRRGPSPTDTDVVGADQQRETHSRLEPLGSLAAETDGELFLDVSARLDRALASIAVQSQDYYIVGFAAPPDAVKDRPKYRRVTIRVTRRGARVSARTGYSLDVPDRSPASRRRAIDAAFAAPYPEQGFPIEFTTYVFRGNSSGTQKIVLAVGADLPASGENSSAPADVVFAVQDVRTGRVVSSGTQAMSLAQVEHREPHSATATSRVQFEAPPGRYVARVVVREPGGLVASADRSFDVRDLDGPALSASDLIIGSQHDALPVRLRTSAADVLTGTFELYGRTDDQLRDLDVRVDLAPVSGDSPKRTMHANLLPADSTNRGTTRIALIEMPLSDIPPGRYMVRADVASGGTLASELTREIEIVPGDWLPTPARPADDHGDRTFVPEKLLNGDAVRRYLDGVRQTGPAIAKGVQFAAAGAWNKVEGALGSEPGAIGIRGLARLATRDYDSAATLLASALDDGDRSAAVAFFLGWAQSARGDLRAAVSAWRRAAFMDPTFTPAHLALADAYVDLGERALAIQAVRAGLTALPGSPELTDKLSRLESR